MTPTVRKCIPFHSAMNSLTASSTLLSYHGIVQNQTSHLMMADVFSLLMTIFYTIAGYFLFLYRYLPPAHFINISMLYLYAADFINMSKRINQSLL